MGGTLARGNPTVENVQTMLPRGTAGQASATVRSMHTVRVPLSTTGGTANADLLSWINPENGTIGVTDIGIYFSTTGTGTFDAGVSADGTGSNDNMIDGGTMSGLTTILVSRRGRTGTEGGGTKGVGEWFVLGPGGTGTNNSIVAKTSETATTAVGAAIITYVVLS